MCKKIREAKETIMAAASKEDDYIDEPYTHVALHVFLNGDTHVFHGFSKCNRTDTFNLAAGRGLAYKRALTQGARWLMRQDGVSL